MKGRQLSGIITGINSKSVCVLWRPGRLIKRHLLTQGSRAYSLNGRPKISLSEVFRVDTVGWELGCILNAAGESKVSFRRKSRSNVRAGCLRRALTCAVLLAAAGSALHDQSTKKRVAVFDFDASLTQKGIVSPFFQTTTPNTGKAVADLLLTRLVQDGIVNVIERSALDKLLAEQNLSNTDRTDPTSAAKIGRILGVDAVIVGTITRYTLDDKTTGGGGGGFAGISHNAYTTKHDMKGHVQISARLVSPDTAEVLAVAEGVGEIVRKGVKVDMRDSSRNVLNPNAAGESLMNEVMDKAVAQLDENLKPNFVKIPPRTPVIEGLVADASESGQLILNTGSRSGLKKDDRLQVWRPGKEIRDPTTGRVLLHDDTLLGQAVVTEVSEDYARAIYQGTQPVKVGDVIKNIPKLP